MEKHKSIFYVYLVLTNQLAKGWTVRAQNLVFEWETILFNKCGVFFRRVKRSDLRADYPP
jgi:hypothetical protein